MGRRTVRPVNISLRFKGTKPLRNFGRHSVTTRLDEHSVHTRLIQLLTLNNAKCQAHSIVVGRLRFTY
jgi:hypothetical protein